MPAESAGWGDVSDQSRISYDDAKRMAVDKDPAVRLALAVRSDVMPEILFFLADDPSPEVREAIAANAATPQRADILLAKDIDDSVRSRLAGKIAGVLPNLTAEETEKLGKLAYQALDLLARDQVTRVRQVLAEALKDVAHAPPEVINRLARDAEIVVAGPILEYSPVLADEDLLAVVSDGPVRGALAAIARRDRLTGKVADALARTGDVEAVGVLLGNPSAQIREETLDWIAERAPRIESWHGPLVRRTDLPGRIAVRLAQFVADRWLKVLVAREDFDTRVASALKTEVRRRLDRQSVGPGAAAKKTAAPVGVQEEDDGRPVWKRVRAESGSPVDAALSLKQSNNLNALTVLDALTEGDNEFVTAALAIMGEVPHPVAERIVTMQSAKGIVALAWRAKIPERLLGQLQSKLCRIPPDQILKPRKIGAFPLTEDEMAWQLEFFFQLVTKG